MKAFVFAFATLTALTSQARSQEDPLDWIRAQPEEQSDFYTYGEAAPEALGPAAERKDLVNFKIIGTVAKIDDGDTIDIKGNGNIKFILRFSDIDTPEVAHDAFVKSGCNCATIPYRRGQPGGRDAEKSLQSLVAIGDKVTAECYEGDKYGRLVCHIFNKGVNLNLEQIKRGWGWLPSEKKWIRDPESEVAEQDAKNKKLGAWGLNGQVTPDVWRGRCWTYGECDNAEK